MSGLSQWFSKFSAREKRLIVIAFAVIIFYIAFVYIAEPLYQRYDEILQEKEAEKVILAKYQTILMKRTEYMQKIAQGEAMKRQIDNGLIEAANPEIASAQLQSIVKEFAREIEIDFDRISINPVKELGGYSEIGIRIPFSCYVGELRDFMYKIESSDRLLFISDLDIRVLNTRNPDKLRISMDVSGFIKAETPEKPDDKKPKTTDKDKAEKDKSDKSETNQDKDLEKLLEDFDGGTEKGKSE